MLMKPGISACLGGILLLAGLLASAQQTKPGMLSAEELKKTVPSSYFFRGQSGAVQLRNSAGFRGQDAKLVLAGFVDTSGYAADLAEKYQGFLITEVKLDIEGAELAPGQYGFGFTKGGKFVVMDVGANDLLSVSSKRDEDLKRPVPLKVVEDGGAYKLYAGKSWVSLKVK
jgi:hypothetical protein